MDAAKSSFLTEFVPNLSVFLEMRCSYTETPTLSRLLHSPIHILLSKPSAYFFHNAKQLFFFFTGLILLPQFKRSPNLLYFIACCWVFFPCFVSSAKEVPQMWDPSKMERWWQWCRIVKGAGEIHLHGDLSHLYLGAIQLEMCYSALQH